MFNTTTYNNLVFHIVSCPMGHVMPCLEGIGATTDFFAAPCPLKVLALGSALVVAQSVSMASFMAKTLWEC